MLVKALKWFWPLERSELTSFWKFSALHVLISANFWIVHNLKDTLIVSAPSSGAECINYLKMAVFFATLCFVAVYSRMLHYHTQRVTLRRLVLSFCFLFALFAVLLPYASSFQMSYEKVHAISREWPTIRWLVPVVGYWFFTLFYIAAEMWSMVAYSILFWQVTNALLSLDESRRFYTLFVFFNGVTTVLVAYIFLVLSPTQHGDFKDYLMHMRYGCLAVSIICLLMLQCYRAIYNHFGEKQKKKEEEEVKVESHMPFWSSLLMVLRSWYLGLIFLLGVCYNFAHTVVDVTWKQQVRLLCSTSFAVQDFFWQFTSKMGYGIILCSFISTSFVRRWGWRTSASLTPIVLALSGTVFFISILSRSWEWGAFSTVLFTVTYGQWHELVVKSLKHSIFNVTRELVYVPLDFHAQIRGKAISDVLGGRIGKLLGASVQGILLFFVVGGTQSDIVPYAMTFFWFIIVVWFTVIIMLNKRFIKLVAYKKM